MMLLRSRRYVTLFEILIVMTIIALISGIVAVSLDKAVVDQRFRNEMSMIVDDLRLAQDLMMILGADVRVKFTENKGNKGIKYQFETETKINSSLQNLVLNKPRELKTIRGVFFEDEIENENIEGAITLRFFSRGAVMSRGPMRFSLSGSQTPQEGILESFVYLPGYPALISSTDNFNVEKSDFQAEEAEKFNQLVSHSTFGMLPEKIRNPPVVNVPADQPATDQPDPDKPQKPTKPTEEAQDTKPKKNPQPKKGKTIQEDGL